MTKGAFQPEERGSLAFLEEVFHTFRAAPLGIIACYYVGTLPFVAGLLYFWSDMAHGAFADGRVVIASLGMAILFVWMKGWQAVFARRLMANMSGEPTRLPAVRRFVVLACFQGLIHAVFLVVLAASLFIIAPFGYVYALCQNLTVLDDNEQKPLVETLREAARMAGLWPMQNHVAIWLLSPFLVVLAGTLFFIILPIVEAASPEWFATYIGFYAVILVILLVPLNPFGIIVALNIASFLVFLPVMLRTLLGVETVFTLDMNSMVNPAFFVIVCGMTYLCLDPLIKTAYVLRCFHGHALHSGRDLRVRLARLKSAGMLVIIASLGWCVSAEAQEADTSSERSTPYEITELHQALDHVLQRPEYAWRLPRIVSDDGHEGILVRALTWMADRWADFLGFVGDVWDRFWDWWDRVFGGRERSANNRLLDDVSTALRWTLYLLLAVIAAGILLFLWRILQRRETASPPQGKPVSATPDLADESTTADLLPEEEWLAWARELIAKGDYRLAMRAAFLAVLARLRQCELIRIAPFKSNLDYARELERVAHVHRGTSGIFATAIKAFEAVWYGDHPATRDDADALLELQERLPAHEQ